MDATSLRAGGRRGDDPRARRATTAVQVDEIVPRSFPVLALSVPIERRPDRPRAASSLFALVALGAGAWIGRSGRGDVADQFLVRHADRILPVAAFTPGAAVVDVSDAESLHRVAERFDTVVLHHAGPDGQTSSPSGTST